MFPNIQLKCVEHITWICNSANRSLDFILTKIQCIFQHRRVKNSFIPLKHFSAIYYSAYNVQRVSLESIQRKFSKFLSFKCDGTFSMRQTTLPSRLNCFSFFFIIYFLSIDSFWFLNMTPFNVQRCVSRNSLWV